MQLEPSLFHNLKDATYYFHDSVLKLMPYEGNIFSEIGNSQVEMKKQENSKGVYSLLVYFSRSSPSLQSLANSSNHTEYLSPSILLFLQQHPD